ncbi:hypothetical protein WJX82_005691 [Trebouxia sp. C0006]
MASLQISCSSGLSSNNVTGCSSPAWDGNAVQAIGQSPDTEQGGPHGYGGVMAYPPFSITLAGEPDMVCISNGITPFSITARVHDMAGNVVTAGVSTDSEQPLIATVNVTGIPNLPVGVPTPALPGHTQGAADITGIINITDIVLVAYPWVYNLSVTLTGFPQVPAAWKMVQVQNCTTGQVQQNAAICSTCPAATFPLNESCDACPAGATCFGGSHFIPSSQSWHSHPYSTNIVQCPNAKPCQGDRTTLLNCTESAGFCNMTAGMDTSQSESYMAPWIASPAEEGERPARVSELLKAVTLWLQYTSLLAGVNIPAPATLHWVFSAVNFAFSTVTSSSLSTDCLLSRPLNAALQRILIHLSVPVLVLAAMVLIQVVWWAITLSKVSLSSATWTQTMIPVPQTLRTWHGNIVELQRRLLVTLLSVLFFYYPSLLTTILSLFACHRIDPSSPTGTYPQFARATWAWGYWLPDMSIRCFVGWHLRLSLGLGVPLLLLGCVLIPALPCLLLLRHRRQLQSTAIKVRLDFIFCSYRSRFWSWESVILTQTLGLAAAQVFATALDAFFQLTIMLVILMISLILLAHYRPFEEKAAQITQVLGLATVSATAVGCQMLLDTNNVANSRGLSATGVLLMILNVAFLAVSGVLIVRRGRRHDAAFAQQTKGITKTVFQCLRRPCTQQSRQPHVVVNPNTGNQDGNSVLSRAEFKQAMMP